AAHEQAHALRPLPPGPQADPEGDALRAEPGGPAQDRRRAPAHGEPPQAAAL
ncbi:MAG: hypothetical protein AVDCRST_MAG45-1352, partial [uncultured Solirubrobacterales bacterium]